MNNFDNILPIFLAAGLGTRLGSEPSKSPKALVEIGGKKIIEIQLKILKKLGITDVIIVTGHETNKIIASLGANYGPIRIHYETNTEYATTGSACSLLSSFGKWQSFLRPVLLLHADIIYDEEVLIKFLNENTEGRSTILLDKNFKELTKDEQVVLVKEKKVTELIKGKELPPNAIGESLGINYWSVIFMEKYFTFLSNFLINHNKRCNWEQTIKPFLDSSPHTDIFYSGIKGRYWMNINYLQDFNNASEMYKTLKI